MSFDSDDVKVGCLLITTDNWKEPGRLFLVLETFTRSSWTATDWLVEAKVWSLFDQKIASYYVGPRYWRIFP